MAIFQYPHIFLLTLTVIYIFLWKRMISRRTTSAPTNWPVAGMLPSLLQNYYRLHAYVDEILSESGGSFEFKGPWFSNMDMLFTCDPKNIHHIFSRNFANYPKGPEFRKIFEILGDGIFNADFELWELHRSRTLSLFTDARFNTLLERAVWRKVESGLIPVLDHFSERGIVFDLHEVLQRFTFDSTCQLVLDHDPVSLSIDMPYVPSEKAFNDTFEVLLHRHFLPETIWKLQSWLGIGKERKLIQARKAFDEFLYPAIEMKMSSEKRDAEFSLLAAFKKAYEEKNGGSSDNQTRNFLRDTALNLMFAGRDSISSALTWLFWLVAKNPVSLSKIRDEMEKVLHLEEDKKWRMFSIEESRKLIYLHGALCESMRLFPPVPLEHKAPVEPDVLPSGNSLGRNGKVIVSFYSTGRMESLWGPDCLEFRPHRWISRRGGMRHEPSYKFPAFNAGPRTCLGKDMAFIQMKMIASAIFYHYNIELVGEHQMCPRGSVVMKPMHGLRVRLSKRNVG